MRLWLKILFVFLFVWGLVIPIILLVVSNKIDLDEPNNLLVGLGGPLEKEGGYQPHEKRKILDYNPELHTGLEEMRFQAKELENIVLSVRNELRTLEQERTRLRKEVDTGRSSLGKVRKQVTITKAELQDTKGKLARTLREIKRASQRTSMDPVKSSIVVVNLQVPSMLADDWPADSDAGQRDVQKHSTTTRKRRHIPCSREGCLDYSRCPLTKPFGVYFYNQHHADLFDLEYPELVKDLIVTLTKAHSLVSDPDLACMFVVIVGPLKVHIDEATLGRKLEALPYWHGGSNHAVIHMAYSNETVDIHSDAIDLGRAIHIRSFTDGENFNDLLLPPISSVEQFSLPQFLPTFRPTFLIFEGQMQKKTDKSAHSDHGTSPDWLTQQLLSLQAAVSRNTQDRLSIITSCTDIPSTTDGKHTFGEWQLCGTEKDRAHKLSTSTFSLVLNSRSGSLGPVTYLRLVEALRFGAIPVLVGIEHLPLAEVIDWKAAAISVPPSSLGQLHYILRHLDSNTILKFRWQGKHLWETYFKSPSRMLEGILAVVRWRALHPPPAAMDYYALTTYLSQTSDVPPLTPSTFQYNFTTYNWAFWNSPPGPNFMYPVTPFKPTPVSGSQYATLSKEQLSGLPSHVVAGGGITGPFFEDFLLGNVPEEQFTVVILTYERNQVLLDAIGRLSNMDHLAKVVVIWNNPDPPPDTMKWPDIGVAVEVVGAGRNSLNNRFLPFSNIETEAVLSLDDDVHLRHDEIQFAFRVWREARDRIVGFPGRFHAWDARHPGWLYNSNYTCELSMVLTGAAFIHKYYMYLYSQWMPEEIRSMVDHYTNCEDIAMNFLVSHITRKPPLKVTSRWTFRCPGCPETLSSNNEHFNERHICMNKLVSIYGYMPLLYTQFRLDSILFKTRLPSHLEKCYEYI